MHKQSLGFNVILPCSLKQAVTDWNRLYNVQPLQLVLSCDKFSHFICVISLKINFYTVATTNIKECVYFQIVQYPIRKHPED